MQYRPKVWPGSVAPDTPALQREKKYTIKRAVRSGEGESAKKYDALHGKHKMIILSPFLIKVPVHVVGYQSAYLMISAYIAVDAAFKQGDYKVLGLCPLFIAV